MKRISLRARDGSVRAYALVDDEDHADVSRWTWHLDWRGAYAYRWLPGLPRTRVWLHQYLAGVGRVDHRDGNGLNNQRANLRPATHAQNAQNRGVNRDNRLGVRGVRARGGRFQARVRGESLGTFDTIEQAAVAVGAHRQQHLPYSEEARHGP